MIRILLDPKLFNYVILMLFALTSIRWALAGNWPQAWYWLGALILNIAVTAMAT